MLKNLALAAAAAVMLSGVAIAEEAAVAPVAVVALEAIDTNADGAVAADEFAAFYGDKADTAVFTKLDADANGTLNAAEAAALPAKEEAAK